MEMRHTTAHLRSEEVSVTRNPVCDQIIKLKFGGPVSGHEVTLDARTFARLRRAIMELDEKEAWS